MIRQSGKKFEASVAIDLDTQLTLCLLQQTAKKGEIIVLSVHICQNIFQPTLRGRCRVTREDDLEQAKGVLWYDFFIVLQDPH